MSVELLDQLIEHIVEAQPTLVTTATPYISSHRASTASFGSLRRRPRTVQRWRELVHDLIDHHLAAGAMQAFLPCCRLC